MTTTLTSSDPASFAADKASFYADPIAWMILAAVTQTLADIAPDPDPDTTALIVTSTATTLPTCQTIAVEARRGRIRPLRFAGANPGILAGLSCIRLGLRGPSMVLLGDPTGTARTAQALASQWQAQGQARLVMVVDHRQTSAGHRVTCRRVAGED
ncbi:polyketide synthase [Thermomonospora umbrina]|uniref:Beta-ketoacyl synthase-like protein n=1 Tax=Thermomonospora umbrina TaxID=111806 RepID=A0A3D9SWT7_9ACTN|nr:polyketide synthase [Thermomonospora umbrina]REF00407.1 hypothetical protein DFJ69_5942 [Thermomonospora umbrina]